MRGSIAGPKRPMILLAQLLIVELLFLPRTLAAIVPCGDAVKAGSICACDVRALRPLQGAVGMEEVRDKARKITAKPDKEWKDLMADPIKVVRGPGGKLYITDHHHGADAWRIAGHPDAVCQINARPAFESEDAFFKALESDRLVHLADADGNRIKATQLPTSLEAMPDDPYRSLAWRVRKDDGFCRSLMPQKEFAEFTWADWLRTRREFPKEKVSVSAKNFAPTAVALARSPAAESMPGYVGAKPAGFKCPAET